MKTAFHSSFTKDLRSVKDQKLLDRVADLIAMVEQAADLATIPNLKKLQGTGPYYRVRLGDYRVGISVQSGVVSFIRFLHRKEIYRFFPK